MATSQDNILEKFAESVVDRALLDNALSGKPFTSTLGETLSDAWAGKGDYRPNAAEGLGGAAPWKPTRTALESLAAMGSRAKSLGTAGGMRNIGERAVDQAFDIADQSGAADELEGTGRDVLAQASRDALSGKNPLSGIRQIQVPEAIKQRFANFQASKPLERANATPEDLRRRATSELASYVLLGSDVSGLRQAAGKAYSKYRDFVPENVWQEVEKTISPTTKQSAAKDKEEPEEDDKSFETDVAVDLLTNPKYAPLVRRVGGIYKDVRKHTGTEPGSVKDLVTGAAPYVAAAAALPTGARMVGGGLRAFHGQEEGVASSVGKNLGSVLRTLLSKGKRASADEPMDKEAIAPAIAAALGWGARTAVPWLASKMPAMLRGGKLGSYFSGAGARTAAEQALKAGAGTRSWYNPARYLMGKTVDPLAAQGLSSALRIGTAGVAAMPLATAGMNAMSGYDPTQAGQEQAPGQPQGQAPGPYGMPVGGQQMPAYTGMGALQAGAQNPLMQSLDRYIMTGKRHA